MAKLGRVIIAFFISLNFISCGMDESLETYNLNTVLDNAKKQAAKPSDKKEQQGNDLSEIIKKRRVNYMYSSVGKRDPFRSYFGDFKLLEKDKKIVSELQTYDLADLKLTAIVWGITEPRGVIIAPNGKSHFIKKGQFIGKNWGKVSRLFPDKIEIIETYKDPLGRKILNKLYIELPVRTGLEEGIRPF